MATPLSEEQTETIHALLEGRDANGHPNLAQASKRILEVLVKHYADPHESLPGDQLAAQANIKSGIFVAVKKLRAEISVVPTRDWHASIENEKGYYLNLKFVPSPEFHFRRFWRSYQKPADDTHISYTELRFFRSLPGKFFFRHLDINDSTEIGGTGGIAELSKDNKIIKELLDENAGVEGRVKLKDTVHSLYYFTTRGEMACVLALIRQLEKFGAKTHYSANDGYEKLYDECENLWLLGNKRTHPAIRKMQDDPDYNQGWRWRIGDHGIDFVDSAAGEPYNDDIKHGHVYALLSRMPGTRAGTTVTIIAANHGEAYMGIAQLITSESEINKLFSQNSDKFNWSVTKPVPDRFQMLFSVEIDSDEHMRRGKPTKLIAASPSQT